MMRLEAERSSLLQGLIKAIFEIHADPEDALEITALLESMGWSDERVRTQLEFEDIFQLSEFIWEKSRHRVQSTTNNFIQDKPIIILIKNAIQHFVRGTIFALPMAVSIAAMLYLHLSLWAYQYLSVPYATSIAIGTVLSFVTVGGFMQGIARQGYYYIFQGYYNMAQRMTFRFIFIGLLVSVLVSLALFFADELFPILPINLIGMSIAFYIVLNAIWLSVTVMYILKNELLFTGLLILGILLVYVEFHYLHFSILFSQEFTMSIIAGVGVLIVWRIFQRNSKRNKLEFRIKLSRPGVLVYSIMPYFLYGSLYFLLLFVDRMMAWSNHEAYTQYFIWFRGDYEVGLDFALISLIIPTGATEVLVNRIMEQASLVQMRYYAWQTEDMCAFFLRMYRRGLIMMISIATASSILDYLLVKWLLDGYLLSFRGEVNLTSLSNFVFIIGICAYGLLACALLNSVIMFSLSRPDYVLRPIFSSIVVNLLTGFLLSRWFGYQYAVIGLLIGALVFTIWTTINVLKVFRKLDYHLYLLA